MRREFLHTSLDELINMASHELAASCVTVLRAQGDAMEPRELLDMAKTLGALHVLSASRSSIDPNTAGGSLVGAIDRTLRLVHSSDD